MQNKHLILLSDNYPNSNGEFFLDDEMNLIAHKFEKISVFCMSPSGNDSRPRPKNLEIITPAHLTRKQRMLFSLYGLFFLPLWQEFFLVKKHFNLRASWILFKILLADYVRSSHLMATIKKNIALKPDKHILYSYWHDYKALAIARICKKEKIMGLARGHGWDVDYERHNPPYLPFKSFMIRELDLTVSISDFGAATLKKISDKKYHHKIMVSRLGKINTRAPRSEPSQKEKICICSCSSLIELKRIHLIVTFIEKLQDYKVVQWIHFGDGSLRKEIENLAQSKNISFELKGNLANNLILDYYNSNYIDLFINFSSSEGIPVSIMEAQSAGIPVLATAVGGTPEIVNDDNGFLVEKDFDMHAAVERVAGLLNGPQEQIQAKREAAYTNWFNNYNAEKNYKEFVELLLTENQNHLT
jgi:glycosyltransferase involved in cell wall biosynthesis